MLVKIPWYKYLLSHIWDQELNSGYSPYNQSLELSLSKGRLRLDTENATYSFEDLYLNFYKAFESLKLKPNSVNDALILGFGLGSIAQMLNSNFKQSAQIVGFEIDPVITAWAESYLPKKLLANIKLFEGDAFDFLSVIEKREFDLIAFDVFIDDETDEQFRSNLFLKKLKETLNKKGVMVYNMLYLNTEQKDTCNKFYATSFKTIFPKAIQLEVKGNCLLIVDNRNSF